jgi:hypothetical protein
MEGLGYRKQSNYRTPGGPMAYRRGIPASLALAPEQQAEVAALIETAGLDASESVWAVQLNSYHLIGPLVSALIHTPTSYSFRFEFLESVLDINLADSPIIFSFPQYGIRSGAIRRKDRIVTPMRPDL